MPRTKTKEAAHMIIGSVPPSVRETFKIACATKGVAMNREMIRLMQDVIVYQGYSDVLKEKAEKYQDGGNIR